MDLKTKFQKRLKQARVLLVKATKDLKTLPVGRVVLFGTVSIVLVVGGSVGILLLKASTDLPDVTTIAEYRPKSVTRVYGKNRKGEEVIIGEFFRERREVVPFEKISTNVQNAFLAAEDESFFQHEGINFWAIARATLANLKAGEYVQGGSTITQQVVKSLFLSSEKSLVRKLKEFFLARKIEKTLSKKEILFLYLNHIYLGSGSYGVEAASKTYFQKSVDQISLAEAAILAGLPQAPAKYSPVLNPKRAKERQMYVLRRMKDSGFIQEKDQLAAGAETIRIYGPKDPNKRRAPWVVEHLRRYVQGKYGENAVYQDGLTVKTDFVLDDVNAAHDAIQQGLLDLDKRRGWRGVQKRLKPEEVGPYLIKKEKEAIDDRYGYRLMTPKGEFSRDDFFAENQIGGVRDLVFARRTHEGVVARVDNAKKVIVVRFGPFEFEIAKDGWKWIQPYGNKDPDLNKYFQPNDLIAFSFQIMNKTPVYKLEQYPEVEAALISIDNQTGQVLAMAGGFDFDRSEFNRAIQAKRQVGSTFKPVVYSAALEKGYTPSTIILDAPIVYKDEEYGTWKPLNYEEKFYGETPFRKALIDSRNIPTIKLVQDLGIQRMIDFATKMGLEGPFAKDLSISLGTTSISPLDMARIFTAFPRGGTRIEPRFYTGIFDRDGKVLEGTTEPKVEESLDPRVAYIMTHLMKEVVEFGTGRRARVLGRPVAGKTGTSNDNRDAWFVGFTPQVSTIVWVGFDSQISLGSAETGANAALPIWIDYMGRVLSRLPVEDFKVPEGIVFVPIDPDSGKVVSARNPRAYSEAFIAGTEPGTAGGKRAEYLGGDFKGVAPIVSGQTSSNAPGGMTPPPIPMPAEDPTDAPSIGIDEEYLNE